MTPLITTTIPPQNFELIRDQIGLILGTELKEQYLLNNSYPNVSKVWVERFIPFDADTEIPTLNVSISKGDYGNQDMRGRMDGQTVYNIDIYTNSPSSEGQPGDQYAMVEMNKIAGMVLYILRNPSYRTLGFTNGSIINAQSVRFFIADKLNVKDALSDVIGRIQFQVKAVETSDSFDSGNALNVATTTTTLNESPLGYYYEFDTP